jgi:class 3 adenylate cyclase/predicted Ser/Thr protein kinase
LTEPDDKGMQVTRKTPSPSDPRLVGPLSTYEIVGPSRPHVLLPPEFGRYRIDKMLGTGGMGAVYLAQDTQLDRPVALKVPHFPAGPTPQAVERFYQEARAAALLHHPHICPVFDVGSIGEIHYLTMAYIEGQTLAEWLRQSHPLPVRKVVELIQLAARALEEAHLRGVIHRDLKPANIMIDRRGEPVVMDFGLARRLDLGDLRLTQQGQLMGTPAYMSPEQVNGGVEQTGPASDIYSLGVVLYELLTGRLPFMGPLSAVLAQIAHEEPRPPSQVRADLDRRIDGICRKALAKEPARRFPTMAALADVLTDYLRGKPGRSAAPADQPALSLAEPKLMTEVLNHLRTWGWAMGLKKLKAVAHHCRDPRKRDALEFYHRWLGGEADAHAPALEQFPEGQPPAVLLGWALAGQAGGALRDHRYPRVHQLLDQAGRQGDPADTVCRATLAHTRGIVYSHEGKFDRARQHLDEALRLLGKEHFATGRVLDSLGMVHAYHGNFSMARELYEQAIGFKERHGDEVGLAVNHGQLGRLYLEWGWLDQAEHHFQIDLRLAQKLLDERGEALMYNHLGQVALARGDREAAAGRRAAARHWWNEAAGWLESSIQRSQASGAKSAEGFARKDRAIVHLQLGELAPVTEHLDQAEALFQSVRFEEGLAQVQFVRGMLRRIQGRFDEATRLLRAALGYFDETLDRTSAARTQRELARTLHASGAHLPLVARAYVEALARAEACRRAPLVEVIEEELREVDRDAYFRHIYRRVRGRSLAEDTPSLTGGAREGVTVLAFRLQGFTEHARGLDAEGTLLCLNQIFGEFADVLEQYRAQVTAHVGDGFLAVLRDADHAGRAVELAFDLLRTLSEFNRPREVLELPLFQARIAVHTGEVSLGNVGTYRKLDFTAVGAAVSEALCLLHWAEPDLPCLTQETWEQVADRFEPRGGSPRVVWPPGSRSLEVWDVVGRFGRGA